MLKRMFLNAISLGIDEGLSEDKKLAIRISVADAYWSLVAMGFYFVYSLHYSLYPAAWIHLACFCLTLFGTFLFKYKKFDFARILIHLVGLFEIFITADAAGTYSGYEYYYFISIAMPFITFTHQEQLKATVLTAITCSVLIFQQFVGHGFLMDQIAVPDEDRLIAIIFVMSYVLTVFTIGRLQLERAQKNLEQRQKDLMKASNLIALGEMSAGIAHEINNPLQSLSLNLLVMKEKFPSPEFGEHYTINDNLIRKMAKMVQNLKDLSKDEDKEPTEVFLFSKILEEVLIMASDKIKKSNVQVFINGDSHLEARGHVIQMQQVLINLINNSLDAVSELDEKWIKIDIDCKGQYLQVSVTDSGKGIPSYIAENMMKPFYTTKSSNKGTGLGLSISKNILTKNEGSLYYDSQSPHTKFVMLIPIEK